jgi:hypothetical protein
VRSQARSRSLRVGLLLGVAALAPAERGRRALAAGDGGVALPSRQTTSLSVTFDLGAPVERAVPGRAYALAVAKDREQRWAEAAVLYQQAAAEWAAALRTRWSQVLARAQQKAESERLGSQRLASLQPPPGRPDAAPSRMSPLDRGRLYRAKLMVVRAFTGTVPAGLYARAREAFAEALRAGAGGHPENEAEIRLLLCATHAAAGDLRAARLTRARVPEADRQQPGNALPMAVCAAALGEDDEALARLELFVVRPPPHRLDPYSLRDLYIANDWDRLRGGRRFETLFR